MDYCLIQSRLFLSFLTIKKISHLIIPHGCSNFTSKQKQLKKDPGCLRFIKNRVPSPLKLRLCLHVLRFGTCTNPSVKKPAAMTSRKTQQEIEKTFKKVAEGMATFEGIHEKIKVANNTTQRDRLEENLKREIKKLQRFRDQIKTWAAGNEVKDKTPLLEQRRAIETVRLSATNFPVEPGQGD